MTNRTSRPPRRRKKKSHMRGSDMRIGHVGKLRTIDELADRWGVSPRTVQRLINSGRLRKHRIGRLVRISDADAAAYLDENCDD